MTRRKNRIATVNKPYDVQCKQSTGNPVAVIGRKRRLKKSGTNSGCRVSIFLA